MLLVYWQWLYIIWVLPHWKNNCAKKNLNHPKWNSNFPLFFLKEFNAEFFGRRKKKSKYPNFELNKFELCKFDWKAYIKFLIFMKDKTIINKRWCIVLKRYQCIPFKNIFKFILKWKWSISKFGDFKISSTLPNSIL